MNRAFGLIFLAALSSQPVFAQFGALMPPDLTGTWRWLSQEDERDRAPGAYPGDYRGLPLNDAARMRADTYDEEWNSTSPLNQCRSRGPTYQPKALDDMQIDKEVDPITRKVVAYRVSYWKTPGERMIWLDGRDIPSPYAKHSWDGFSSGQFRGDTLEITTTHLKDSFVRRNGVPSSFRATVIEQVSLEEPYLEWTFTVIDPDYLTEPIVRSATYVRDTVRQLAVYPCQPEEYQPGSKYRMPHYLPGTNPYLTESAVKYKTPLEGSRGGAETMYPEWQVNGKKLISPAAQYVLKPIYKDASTRIAELADAQPKRAPTYENLQTLHVTGNVYMIAGAGGNIAISVGGDGVVLVDSGAAAASARILDAIRQTVRTSKPPQEPESASRFSDTWQATHAAPGAAIRMIINTNDNPDHIGGNASIQKSSMFRPIGSAQSIYAHEKVQGRMLEATGGVPDATYISEKYTLYRFFNDQPIQLFHLANAITDGDSAVWFRRSDVIVTGDVYNSDVYPPIDVERGGSIDGEIDALDKIVDMSVTEFMAQGGTMIIPGHGWISDASDVGYYRDMMMVIRDRVQDMIKKGMTLEQVKTAKPTMDYDPEFGRQPGATAKFVEAVYRSLAKREPDRAKH
jgi:glyoxylase-like metal-dependent hydrolase (beta-lactamase superfamily II)